MLIADFNLTFFLKTRLEVLKLVQKTKLNSAEDGTRARENSGHGGEEFEGFFQSLSDVDFNNRSEESKYK